MRTYYDLIPSQQNIYLLVKFSFHKEIVQIPACFSMEKDIDFDLLTKALNIEIQRNDSLRLRFKKVDGDIKQYFLEEYHIDSVPTVTFSSDEEMDEYFGKDAVTPVHFLKGEIFRIVFFKRANGNKGVYLNCSHLAIDAMGMLVFFMDLLGVYKALLTGGEMPEPLYSYEEYIVKELERSRDEKRLAKGQKFYQEYFAKGGEPFYAGVHGPELLEKERKKEKNPNLHVTKAAYAPFNDKALVITRGISAEDSKKILDYCVSNNVAPETLFTFAMRTYCSAINYRTEDVFYNLMCSKRVSFKDVRTGGCMAQTLQVRTIIPETDTFQQGLEEVFRVRTQLYRHLSYPFVYARGMLMKMYNHSTTQGVASFMFSWLPIPIDRLADFKFDFKTYNLGRYFNPLYAICYPDPTTNGIMMHYMYRCKVVSEADVIALHDNMVKIIMTGIEHPDTPIGKLMDDVKR